MHIYIYTYTYEHICIYTHICIDLYKTHIYTCVYMHIYTYLYIYSAYFCACILGAMTPETGVIQRKWKGAKIEGSRKGVFLSREGYSPPCSIYPRFLGTWVLVVYIYIYMCGLGGPNMGFPGANSMSLYLCVCCFSNCSIGKCCLWVFKCGVSITSNDCCNCSRSHCLFMLC